MALNSEQIATLARLLNEPRYTPLIMAGAVCEFGSGECVR